MEDTYFRERASDIKDLGLRILVYLQEEQPDRKTYFERTILIGDEVTASALADVPEGYLAGLVSVSGSANSHVAILARALGIPTTMGVEGLNLGSMSIEGQDVIVDGYYGQVYLNPSAELWSQFKTLAEEETELDTSLQDLFGLPAVTPDGYHVSYVLLIRVLQQTRVCLSLSALKALVYLEPKCRF